MLSTALLIVAGLLLLRVCTSGLSSSRQRRVDRTTSPPDEAARERAEALRQRAEALQRISPEIDKGKDAGGGFYGF
jgi:hypothetical protein